MDIYNKLSTSYDRTYKANIEAFQDRLKKVWKGDGWFIDFYPSLGIKPTMSCELLFYGQALNGWEAGFDVFDSVNDNKLNHSIATSNKYFGKLNHSPIDWVNVRWSNSTFDTVIKDEDAKQFYENGSNYRTYRSFFWNVTAKLTCDYHGLNRESWDWAKKIAWSNLYKIAEDGKNPNNFLCEQQIVLSAELVRQEIEELKPKYCIILTNHEWWQPFQKLIGTISIPFDKSLDKIVSVEQYYETKLIVTTRPRFGSGESHVKQILSLL